ncbi:FAD-dependent monooxygenase [Pseudarthrobacter sp. MM222]
MRALYLVGADGGRSAARQAAGAEFPAGVARRGAA